MSRYQKGIFSSIKDEMLDWERKNQQEIIALRESSAIADAQLKQDLARMEEKFKGERERIRLSEEHETSRFAEFLEGIDSTKEEIIKRYPGMPKPIALLIHHHATELLKEAWNNPDFKERAAKQLRLQELYITIEADLNTPAELTPTKTIKFIRGEE